MFLQENILMVLSPDNTLAAGAFARKVGRCFGMSHEIILLEIEVRREYDGFSVLYDVIESGIDTGRFRSLKLTVTLESLPAAICLFSELLPPGTLVIACGETFEIVPELMPGILLYYLPDDYGVVVDSVRSVSGFDDIVVASVGCAERFDFSRLRVLNGFWRIDISVSAVVLAGGRSSRMGGSDKALFRLGERTMLQHVAETLGEWFSEIVVSAGEELRYDLPGRTVVSDRVSGVGPVMGLIEGLRAVSDDLAFVTAVDMPEIKPGIISRLTALVGEADGAILVGSDGRAEPLFAVYRKRVVTVAESYIETGGRSMMGLVDRLNVRRLVASQTTTLTNINTPEEMARYLNRRDEDSTTDSTV